MSSIKSVRIYKNPGESLGFIFNKKAKQQNKVYSIQEGSALDRSKEVIRDDIIISINNRDVRKFSSSQLIDMISTLEDDTEVLLGIERPLSNGTSSRTPSISIDIADDLNTSMPSQEEGKKPTRSRRQGIVLPKDESIMPKIAESEEHSKTVHLQPKDLMPLNKRLSLTPETKHRGLIPLHPSKSLDLGALPTWRNKSFVSLQNYWTGEQQTDRLFTQGNQTKTTGCHPTHCVGSQIWPKEHPRSRPYGPPRPKDKMTEKAEEFIRIYYDSQKMALGEDYDEKLQERLKQVKNEIEEKGHYDLTYEELVYGARLAWRNAPRCVNRIVWRQLEVLDARDVNTTKEMFEAICDHLRYATNGGNIRSTITVFRHRTKPNSDFRVWNVQLIRYAGYKQPDGSIIGDPDSVEFTEVCRRLGWSPPYGHPGMFDVLPLVLQANGGNPEVFVIPNELVLQIDIIHPEYKWFRDLNLRWYAVPAVSALMLDVGGLEFTAAPFNGWYMSSEIGARNFSDEYRYNMLKPVAEKLGLNTGSYRLWRDRALVEINTAVLYSYQKAGVTIVDHHSATESFMTFFKNESVIRGGCPADWVWLVPPISGGTTKLFHQEMLLYYLSPSYEYQEEAWKYYHLPGDMPRLGGPKKFKTIINMVIETQRMMKTVRSKRIKATVLYATETGRSKNYANIVKNLFDRTFNCSVYSMDEYNKANLEHEQLVLIVTSTFGSGDPPSNGELFGRYLLDLRAGRVGGFMPQKRSQRVSAVVRPSPEMLAKAREDMAQPLSQVKYAVFGLGSRAYPNFCAFAHTMDNLFMSLGAEQTYPCGEGDELCGQEESFQSWLRECYMKTCELYRISPRIEENEFTPGKSEYKKDCFRITPFRDVTPTKDLCRDLSHVHNKKVHTATLKSRSKLQSQQSERSTILVTLEPQHHMSYQPGDHIAIYAQNNPNLVKELLGRLNLPCSPDEPIIVESSITNQDETTTWVTERRLPVPVTLIEAFTYYLDITTPPTPQLLQLFQKMATRQVDQETLQELGRGGDLYEDWKYERFPNLIEVLDQFHSLKLDVALLLQQLPLLQCRYYSISSSPKIHPNEIHITVAVVMFRKRGGRGPRHYGVCSTWLNKLETGSTIPCVVRRAISFHMPDDTHTPIIMVGPGTGIAPFRGFWQERMHARGEALKKQLLSAITPTQPPGPRRIKKGQAQIPDTPANKISIGTAGGLQIPGHRRGFVSTVTAPVASMLEVEIRQQAPVSDLEGEDDESDLDEDKDEEDNKPQKKIHFDLPTNKPFNPLRRSASDEFQSKNLAELIAARRREWGEMTLYFGCRRSDTDYIYKEEIQKAHITGALTNVRVAFSRETDQQKTYVQHLLKKDADMIVQQLIEERGHFYVCGDISMAADVGRTLQNIFEENAAMSADEARQLIESMKDNGYYHEDIFGVTLKTAEVTNRVRAAAKKAWRILVTAADGNPLTPMSARPPVTPTTPAIPDTPIDGSFRIPSRLPKRPTVTVLIPTPTSANEPVSPMTRLGSSQPFPDILGQQNQQPILTSSINRRAKYYRSRLGSNSLQEEEEESEETKVGMIRITDYGNSSEKTILEPQSPTTKPDDVMLRKKSGTDEESHKKRRALRKIRSNSLVQTDV